MALPRVLLLLLSAGVAFAADADFPQWAYTVAAPPKPPVKSPAEALARRQVPGSAASYSRNQIEGKDGAVVDWQPGDHPPMPDIIKRIRPETIACAQCHLPNGIGYPQNSSLAGLSANYIKQQVAGFRLGLRVGSSPT